MKSKMTWLFGLLLGLALMLGMSLTAYADDTPPYANLKDTTTEITFDGKSWYLIDYDDNTVTLLAKECVGASRYNSAQSSYVYSGSTVETAVNNYYTSSITSNAKIAVSGSGMFLLTKDQANALSTDVKKCSQASGTGEDGWWLCSQGLNDYSAAFVYGWSGGVNEYGYYVGSTLGVRPALQLNLSSVIFSSQSNTFSLPVTGVTLNPSTAQKTTVGDKVPFTASIEPTGALKMVKWSANSGAVKLYSDANCTTEVGSAVTDKLTVYAKGITAGTATVTVTATNGTDDTADDKSANCNVTVQAHSFNYAAGTGENANTITATCTADDCDLPVVESKHVATLTIAATGGTYDGTTAYGATITDIYGIQGEAKVKYQKKTGDSTYDTATETPPIDAGDYKASITLGEATASVEYSIATPYPLWVGGVQVTSANKDDVLGNADEGATVMYTPANGSTPATLTLNGANITKNYHQIQGLYCGIYYQGTDALNISLKGNNTDRKSTRLNSSHRHTSRMPSSA